MDIVKIAGSAGDVIDKVAKNERTLQTGILLWVLVFVGFLVYITNISQKEARDAYLASIERQGDKMTVSLDKMTDALKQNTSIMIELKTILR